jgi:outer membrane protein TolC
MGFGFCEPALWITALITLGSVGQNVRAEWPVPFLPPEQRTIQVRDPVDLPRAALPLTAAPATISDPQQGVPERLLSLDEAIRTALANAQVVRVLAGVTAVSSGRTIYDTATANTAIDQAQGRFDPALTVQNSWSQAETPRGVFADPAGTTARIDGVKTEGFNFDSSLSKTAANGGIASLNVNANPTFVQPGAFPLNPQSPSSLDVRYTQPLLRGAGLAANLAPIVVARIDTQRSYFQYKDTVQELVRGVVEAYWSVVFARTDVWAREQQVRQSSFALDRAIAGLQNGSLNAGDVAQARTALASFRANLLSSRANLLQREAGLRNLLGFPPYDPEQVVPVTPPLTERLDVDWQQILELAEEYRPDLIELKLVLEADQQRLYQARNNALPQLDALALYRWNGLEGEMPLGGNLASGPGQFTDWTLGVNFSVPLGMRQSRAALRSQELIISRDRANLDQGLHFAAHELALTLRNLAQFYEQYVAFTELREAAELNLQIQLSRWQGGITNFLPVLQAITDWGNGVSSQAQTLLLYNTELINLERRTGTILETHGVRFFEERFGSIGPLGRLHRGACYPLSLPPTLNVERYPPGEQPSENTFDLRDPVPASRNPATRAREELLLPPTKPPTTPPRPTAPAPTVPPPTRQPLGLNEFIR